MIGAIVVAGLTAFMSSALATWNNLAVKKRFPGLGWELSLDMPQDMLIRAMCHRLAAKLFYLQSLVFWALFASLTVAKLATSYLASG